MDFDLSLSDEDRGFQSEVRAFLDENLPEGWGTSSFKMPSGEERIEFLRDWQRRLNDASLAAIAWPKEYGGRDASLVWQIIYSRELARRGAPEPINRSAVIHTGPTIIQWGTEEQKARFLPKILTGEEVWCQGFSEPDAGSDLASLRTRAEIRGDNFVVNGQKVWTTRAHYADWCFLLVRTDTDAPKHEGISCLLVDMKSPGIRVQPIRQIANQAEFNEVFFEDVEVPRDMVVGGVNNGWRVATSTLSYERAGQGNTTRLERRFNIVEELCKELEIDGKPRIEDPLVQDQLVRFASRVEALRQIAARAIAAGLQGAPPGADSAVAKLLTSETDQAMSEFGLELAGRIGILTQDSNHSIKRGNIARSYLIMRAATIGAGTSEIQRNVIGERLLGLPKGSEEQ
jgi:alkylation response protein AidB-like acyl-CoA dehydrogenase